MKHQNTEANKKMKMEVVSALELHYLAQIKMKIPTLRSVGGALVALTQHCRVWTNERKEKRAIHFTLEIVWALRWIFHLL